MGENHSYGCESEPLVDNKPGETIALQHANRHQQRDVQAESRLQALVLLHAKSLNPSYFSIPCPTYISIEIKLASHLYSHHGVACRQFFPGDALKMCGVNQIRVASGTTTAPYRGRSDFQTDSSRCF